MTSSLYIPLYKEETAAEGALVCVTGGTCAFRAQGGIAWDRMQRVRRTRRGQAQSAALQMGARHPPPAALPPPPPLEAAWPFTLAAHLTLAKTFPFASPNPST